MELTLAFLVRKLGHITIYLIFTLLIIRALQLHNPRFKGVNYIIAFTVAFFYALSDEYHQSLTDFRDGRWMDVGIDSIGIIMGISLQKGMRIYMNRQQETNRFFKGLFFGILFSLPLWAMIISVFLWML